MLGTVTKQPAEIENYSISYSNDLDDGDKIAVHSITVVALDGSTTGLPVINNYLADVPGQQVRMTISGGTVGVVYKITTKVTTDTGRLLEDEFKLKIREY